MQLAAANPVRLVAVVGVLALLGGGMFVFKATQGGSSSASQQPTLLHTSVRHHHPVTKPKPVATKPKPHKPVVRPTHHPAVAANGLPWSVAHALVKHPVVVVAVVAPGSRIDQVTLSEAEAAAAQTNAGFVKVNAYVQAQIAPLASKVSITSAPAVLVMKRPADVTIQINGWADRDSIAQAVADARDATATPTP